MVTRLTVDVDFKGVTDEQAWAMARHVESMIANLLNDEHTKGNVVMVNYDTVLDDVVLNPPSAP